MASGHEWGNKNYDNVTKALPKPVIVVETGCGFAVLQLNCCRLRIAVVVAAKMCCRCWQQLYGRLLLVKCCIFFAKLPASTANSFTTHHFITSACKYAT